MRAVILLTIVAVALVGGGIMLGDYFETPEEASLRQPPEVVPVTDPLRREVLEQSVTLRGTVTPAERATPRFAAGVQGRVITAVGVQPGTELESGQVLLEVEGRPVIVLTGEFPAWRNFTSSMNGPDVSQLQSALAELGFYHKKGQALGTVGHRTLNAVLALYQSLGYEPPPWSDVPYQEFVFVPSDLRVVERAAVAVGDTLQADAIGLASLARRIEADLTVDQRAAVQPGVTIHVAGSSGTETWSGTIEHVLEIPRADDATGPNAAILTSEPVPDSIAGEQVFEVVLASTGEPALSAASAAVHSSGDGEAFVVVLDGGEETRVPVTVGVVTDNRIQITPVTSASLRPGDALVLNPDR
jgi:peptidoglycan hydrolase-like protein with peptidoglycan-binding domain